MYKGKCLQKECNLLSSVEDIYKSFPIPQDEKRAQLTEASQTEQIALHLT